MIRETKKTEDEGEGEGTKGKEKPEGERTNNELLLLRRWHVRRGREGRELLLLPPLGGGPR